MKGAVFTEFLDLVEGKFGYPMVDRLLTKGCPFHGGYTSVGTYDYTQLLDMVTELADAANAPVPDLVQVFGRHLFGRFLNMYPEAFKGITNTYDLLRQVESAIHVEVRKLTPDAELPSFQFPPRSDGCLELIYQSSRPFADLAEGMIQACIVHYGEAYELEREELPGPLGTHVRFLLRPLSDSSCSM